MASVTHMAKPTDPDVIDAVTPSAALVQQVGTPLPVFRGAEMAQALTAYRELQRALDASMPEQVMELDGKPFRKKGYWRAIAVAFNLTVEPIDERREVNSTFDDGRENFGYVVTYRATSVQGRSATGDGSCFAVEKARRFRCPHPHPKWPGKTAHFPAEACPSFDPAFQWKTLPVQSTEHNIRSHAHTRAFNRAVSNLVGFGEVSAEEVDRNEPPDPPATVQTTGGQLQNELPIEQPRTPPTLPRRSGPVQSTPPQRRAPAGASPNAGDTRTISEPQQRRLHAIAADAGWSAEEVTGYLRETYHTEDAGDILRKDYDALIDVLRAGYSR